MTVPAESRDPMALRQHKSHILPHSRERRRHQRVKVHVQGRYLLGGRVEYPCQIMNMSPGGVAMIAPASGNVGDRVIAYIDHLGRLEGKVVRHLPNGFVMTIKATPGKRDKLAAQLTWLANRHILNLAEDRRHGRFVPRNAATKLELPDHTNVAVQIVDLSLSGAGVTTTKMPALGTSVRLGKIPGRVVRYFEGGFAIEFTRLQHPDSVEENATAQ
jgi:PilZ domain